MGNPAARVSDKVQHPLPGMLSPGPGSLTVQIGSLPAWRGLPALAAAALQAAKAVADAVLQVAETAKNAAMGTPGAPAAIAAEIAVRQATSTAMGALMSGLGAASAAVTGGTPDQHLCMTPIPPPVPHGPGMVIDGSPSVLINGLPACAVGDNVLEALGPLDPIILGMPTVLIGKPAGAGGLGGLLDALKAIIDKVMAAVTKLVDLMKDVAAFVAAVVAGVISELQALVARFGQAMIDAVKRALQKLAEGVKKALAKPPVKTGLGDDVDKLAGKSPTLQKNLQKLQDDGWTIKYGEPGKGSFCDKKAKTIVIDPNDKGNSASITQTLAHESGHALYTADPYVPHNGLTKDEYVRRNVESGLKDEGEATLTNAQVRKEINQAGGPDIGIAGTQTDKYQAIADKYPDPADRDKARKEIADLFGEGENPSTDPSKTYREYYGEPYKKFYDEHPQP